MRDEVKTGFIVGFILACTLAAVLGVLLFGGYL
jgi:hypothetical protein